MFLLVLRIIVVCGRCYYVRDLLLFDKPAGECAQTGYTPRVIHHDKTGARAFHHPDIAIDVDMDVAGCLHCQRLAPAHVNSCAEFLLQGRAVAVDSEDGKPVQVVVAHICETSAVGGKCSVVQLKAVA